MCIPVAHFPPGGSHISHILAPGWAAGWCHIHLWVAGSAGMQALCKVWVSTFSFQLLAEVNGPAEANYSKIIMVNSCVAFGCTISLRPCKPSNSKACPRPGWGGGTLLFRGVHTFVIKIKNTPKALISGQKSTLILIKRWFFPRNKHPFFCQNTDIWWTGTRILT